MKRMKTLRRVSSLLRRDHHAAIEDIVGNSRPSWDSFPWDRLQQYTNEHIKKENRRPGRKAIGDIEELDDFLSHFIVEHGRKEIAVAAVAHALSAATIFRLLQDNLKYDTVTTFGSRPFTGYLQVLLAVRQSHPGVVQENDAELARRLLVEPSGESTLQFLLDLFGEGVPTSSLLSDHISFLFVREINQCQRKLDVAHGQGRYFQAHQLCFWLSNMPPASVLPEALSLSQLLDQNFRGWRAWSAWKPDEVIMRALQTPLNNRTSSSLRELLALEGPSFSDSAKLTERDRLIASSTNTSNFTYDRMSFQLESDHGEHISSILGILRNVLLAITRLNTNERLKIVEYFCYQNPITYSDMRLLKELLDIQKHSDLDTPKVFTALIDVLASSKVQGLPSSNSINILLKTSSYSCGPEFQNQLSPLVINAAAKHFTQLQQHFCSIQQPENLPMEFIQALEMLDSMARSITSSKLFGSMKQYDDLTSSILCDWPEYDDIGFYKSVFTQCQRVMQLGNCRLAFEIPRHLVARLVSRNHFDLIPPVWSEYLSELWRRTNSLGSDGQTYQALGLLLAESISQLDNMSNLKLSCIKHLQLVDKSLAHWLWLFFDCDNVDNLRYRFIEFPEKLAAYHAHQGLHSCWRMIFFHFLDLHLENVRDWILQTLSITEWIQWVKRLGTLYSGDITEALSLSNSHVLRSLHDWVHELEPRVTTIRCLEDEMPESSWTFSRVLMQGSDLRLNYELITILRGLQASKSHESLWKLASGLIIYLDEAGENSRSVAESMNAFSYMTPVGVEACLHIVQKHRNEPSGVTIAFVQCWYQDERLQITDFDALTAVLQVLGIEFSNVSRAESLHIANEYIDLQLAQLLADAEELEALRLEIKTKDPSATRAFLEQEGIEDDPYSPVDNLLLELPWKLHNLVERISDTEIELQLSLEKISPLKRKAIGLGSAQYLVLRLSPDLGPMMAGFCIHSDSESSQIADSMAHAPCLILPGLTEPDSQQCHGRLTGATYQLSRSLWYWICDNGAHSLEAIYDFLIAEIGNISTSCIVCTQKHKYIPFRLSLCAKAHCKDTLFKSGLLTQLPELLEDPAVIDLLLSMAYAAASAGNLNLLPGCPVPDMKTLKGIIDFFPDVNTLQGAGDDIDLILKTLSPSRASDYVLLWLCTHYRGFLVSATDSLKIPQFPGAHQFLLVSASPELEFNFAKKSQGQQNMIVFHGTSWARLYRILNEGLQNLSGTNLQAHGASYGTGIYVSPDPATAFGYSSASKTWSGGIFASFQVILGCELAGKWSPKSSSIYLITDPSCLMVRYLFLIPRNGSVPIANHVTPAMSSVFAGLRRGSL